MKTKYKSIILLITVFILGTSCEDYLEKYPLDSPSNKTFYSNQDEILMAVNACYNNITSVAYSGGAIAFPGLPEVYFLDYITDMAASRFVRSVFKRGEVNSSTSFALLEWQWFYAGIGRVNALLEGMPAAQSKTDPVIYERIKSEARVIRAICYINLIINFGDVPLLKNIINHDEAMNIQRTPKAQILDYIYTELDEAIPSLPVSYSGANWGRITKGVAYAMKARIALYNKDFAVARQAAKAVMDLNVYKMYPNYRDLFTYKAEGCDEIILSYQYKSPEKVHAAHGHNAPRNSNGQSQCFPNEEIVASFECTDGLPIDESPMYDPTNPFASRDPRLFGAIILPRVWDGTTVKTYGTIFNGIEYMSSKENLYAADGTTKLPTSLSEIEKTVLDTKTGNMVANQEITNAYSSFTGYCLLKYIEEANVAANGSCHNDIILCRYAEILLIYAEASIELNQIDQSVLDAMNTIRARAYGNTDGSGITDINAANYPKLTTTDQAELRKVLRRERKVELCFEGFRYDDLRRWGLLTKALNRRETIGRPENFSKLAATDIPQIDDDGLVTISYAKDKYGLNNEVLKLRYYEVFGIIPEAYNLYPIPLSEIQLNSNLTQNPGYN